MNIHPTAIVHPSAELAEDVEVQAYSIIGPHVKIGPGSVVGPHCVVDGRTVLGARNVIYSGAQIGVVSQDKKHRGNFVGRAHIGDDNVFREHVTISASTIAAEEDDRRVTTIGNDCMFMANSHVGHDSHVGNSVIMANSVALAGHVDVHDFANIGGLCGVHQECVVGTMAFVGGLTRVSKDPPPYMIVEGNPPRCGGPNQIGLRRRGLDEATRDRIKRMYKLMWLSKLNTTQALQEIERSVDPSVERETFVSFVRGSVRGIIK